MNTGIPLILNFDLKAPLPLDQRLSINTTSELNSIPNPYSGMPVYSADTQKIYYLKNIINGQKTWIPVPQADEFVVVTGDQSISGVKNFDTYPMVNVEGLMKRVITQGDQSLGALSGIPNFPENAVYNNNILLSSSSSGYLTGNGYSGNYDGGYFFGRTKITQNTNRIIDSSIGNNVTAITGTSIINPLPLTGSWRWLACNSDAKYITASNDSNYLSTSNDYGKTWYQTATDLGPRNWRGISMSAAGKYQIAVSTSSTYSGIVANSEDYGITWSINTQVPDDKTWVAPAVSSDGKYQTVVFNDTSLALPNNPMSAYVSENYGKNFSAVVLPHDPNLVNTRFIAMSSDGKYQTIVVTKNIITSSNYGKNWTLRSVPNQGTTVPFFSVSMTADGRFQIIVTSGNSSNDGEVYTSNNYGVTWKLVKSFGRNISITSVSNSDHGRLITISVKDGFIYTSYDYGNNWTLRTTAQSPTTTLTATINNAVQTIPLASVAGIGTNSINGSRFLLIDDEIIYMQNSSSIAGNQLILALRGQCGTTASTHTLGAKVTLGSDWRRNVMSNDGKYQLLCEANFSPGAVPSTNLPGYIYISVADEKIDGNFYADNLVYNTDQIISGVKTFSDDLNISGDLTLNGGLYINDIEELNLIGANVYADNLVYNTGNQTISGVKNFDKRPTVSGTGVLLSGSIPFIINFGHIRSNTAVGSQRYYFGAQMDIDPVTITNNQKRRIQVLENCFLRKIMWTTIAKTNAPSPTNSMTGYFKNFGTNGYASDDTAGVQVTSGIDIVGAGQFYNSSTGNLNIPITSGDYVSFYYNTEYITATTIGQAVNVAAYFYI